MAIRYSSETAPLNTPNNRGNEVLRPNVLPRSWSGIFGDFFRGALIGLLVLESAKGIFERLKGNPYEASPQPSSVQTQRASRPTPNLFGQEFVEGPLSSLCEQKPTTQWPWSNQGSVSSSTHRGSPAQTEGRLQIVGGNSNWNEPAPSKPLPPYLQPEIVDGVPVYGLGEGKINYRWQLRALISYLDYQFLWETYCKTRDPLLLDALIQWESGTLPWDVRYSLREKFLKLTERYVEVVVSRSAYNSFLKCNNSNTGPSLERLARMHVEAANLLLGYGDVPSNMRVKIRRVIVLPDELLSNVFQSQQHLLLVVFGRDPEWDVPLDTDFSWIIRSNYWPSDSPTAPYRRQTRESPDFWVAKSEPLTGRVIFFTPYDGWRHGIYIYPLPAGSPFATQTDRYPLLLDLSVIKQLLMHLNVDVDSHFNASNLDPFAHFRRFYFFPQSSGRYPHPWISPYSSLSAEFFTGLTDRFGNPEYTFPGRIELRVVDSNKNPIPWELESYGRFRGKNNFGPRDKYPPYKSLSSDSGTATFLWDDIFVGSSVETLLLRVEDGGEIYVPLAFFRISRLTGAADMRGDKPCRCTIYLTGKDDPEAHFQYLIIVPESELDTFLNNLGPGETPYAIGEVDGTHDMRFVWIASRSIPSFSGRVWKSPQLEK
jgi:hypothetical protein